MTAYVPQKVIAVDIGCTRTHTAIVDTAGRKCLFRHDFLSADALLGMLEMLDEVKERDGDIHNLPAVLAGVNDTRVAEIEKTLVSRGINAVSRVAYHTGLPVRVCYEKPASLGADRLADALYAATVHPGENVVIIDSGTAVTIDLITARGEFTGGAIIAGVEAQLRILHSSTGTLPLITKPAVKIGLPGTSTEACMQAGTLYGMAGAINAIVAKYTNDLAGEPCRILATGGAWHMTAGLVDFAYEAVPDLTLIGTALYR